MQDKSVTTTNVSFPIQLTKATMYIMVTVHMYSVYAYLTSLFKESQPLIFFLHSVRICSVTVLFFLFLYSSHNECCSS